MGKIFEGNSDTEEQQEKQQQQQQGGEAKEQFCIPHSLFGSSTKH
jgi:hypothetical protein